MSASMKNAHKKFSRTHMERVQPKGRKKVGFLEKKKDYKKRATDHQEKEQALKKLRQKALDKNPNEFTFHMINSQLKEGRHYEKRADVSREQVRLIEDQDMKYISYKRKLELEKIAKLEASLHRISLPISGPKNKHIIFVDEDNRDQVTERLKQMIESAEQKSNEEPTKAQLKMYKELMRRKERANQLSIILEKMRIKSLVHGTNKNKPQKESDGDKNSAPVYKWPSERQK